MLVNISRLKQSSMLSPVIIVTCLKSDNGLHLIIRIYSFMEIHLRN